jgi:hypothetical protein
LRHDERGERAVKEEGGREGGREGEKEGGREGGREGEDNLCTDSATESGTTEFVYLGSVEKEIKDLRVRPRL